MLAPIVLFAYNRPDHLRRTLAGLQTCKQSCDSKLYVFSDAPRCPEHRQGVDEVRILLQSISGFSEVEVICRETNLGLGKSIIDGVSMVCARHGRVIVLEDDLVVAPGFLRYMNAALDRYADVPPVMQVSGYMFPVSTQLDCEETFLCRMATSWGWATWSRAWTCFEPDAKKLLAFMDNELMKVKFDLQGAYPYLRDLEACANGKLDVWGVRWYASMFLRNGLCLYPAKSLVHNIGLDGSGMHCGASTAFDVSLSQHVHWKLTDDLKESETGMTAICDFLISLQGNGHRARLETVWSHLGRIVRRAMTVRSSP